MKVVLISLVDWLLPMGFGLERPLLPPSCPLCHSVLF